QAGGDIDAIAVEVVVLHDYIAHMEADSKGQPAVLRHDVVALGHAALDLDSALQCVDHAGEFNEEAVASRLDDPAGGPSDGGIDQLTPAGRQSGKGANLVRAHEPAVSSDIGRQDGTESTYISLCYRVHLRVGSGAARTISRSPAVGRLASRRRAAESA